MLKEMDEDEVVKTIISNGIPIRTDFSKNLRIKNRDLVEPFSGFRNLFRSKKILPDKSITKKSSESIILEIPMTPVMHLPGQIAIEKFPSIQDEIIPRTTELADEDDLIKQIASDDQKIEDQMDLTEIGEETIPFPEDSLPLEPEVYLLKKDLPQDIVYEKMEIPSLKFISEHSLPSSKPFHESVIRPSTSKNIKNPE